MDTRKPEAGKGHLRTAVAVALGLVLSACAGTPPVDTTSQMTATRTAISEAREEGAAEHATLELNEAQQKFEQAQAAMQQEEYEQAMRLAREAQVQAELAEITAQTAKADKAATEIQASIRTLQQEIERAASH